MDHQINNIHDLDQTELSERILKVCDILPILTVKTVMQTGKDRGDAPLNLTVTEEKLIICKAHVLP